MTETQIKLEDARTQLELADANVTNGKIVRSCINSFISLGRSVTFLLQTESSDNPKLTAWYEQKMERLKRLPVMLFFQNKRTHTIHLGNVHVDLHSVEVRDIMHEGRLIGKTGTLNVWQFDDAEQYIPGSNKNMFTICKEYLSRLEELVTEWLNEREKIHSTEKQAT